MKSASGLLFCADQEAIKIPVSSSNTTRDNKLGSQSVRVRAAGSITLNMPITAPIRGAVEAATVG